MPAKTVPEPTRNVALAKALAADGRPLYVVGGDAGVNPTLLGRVLKGKAQASPAVRAGLARALGVPEHEIFED